MHKKFTSITDVSIVPTMSKFNIYYEENSGILIKRYNVPISIGRRLILFWWQIRHIDHRDIPFYLLILPSTAASTNILLQKSFHYTQVSAEVISL